MNLYRSFLPLQAQCPIRENLFASQYALDVGKPPVTDQPKSYLEPTVGRITQR